MSGISGLFILFFSAGSSWISSSFIYGESHADRPILTFFFLYEMAWVGVCIASMLVWKKQACSKKLILWIVAVGVAARCLFLPSELIQENDCYRYVLDGEAVLHGVNPYAYSPWEITENAPKYIQDKLFPLESQYIHQRIGYPEIPTIYPPLAQVAFGIGAFLTPWNWMGQRIIFVALDIGTLILILGILKYLRKPLSFSILYAWNPLIIKEISNSAHLDSLVAFCLCLYLYFSLLWVHKRHSFFLYLSSIAFAGSILTKLYPLVLFPIVLVFSYKVRNRKRDVSICFGIVVVCIIVGYIPFTGIGMDKVLEGLRTYNREWVSNQGAFHLITWCTDYLGGNHINYLWSRAISNGIVGVFSLAMAWSVGRKEAKIEKLCHAIQATLLTWLLFLPAVFPWYAIGWIAVATCGIQKNILIISGALGLYYLLFLIDYRGYSNSWHTALQVIEHGIIWIWLIKGYFLDCKQSILRNCNP